MKLSVTRKKLIAKASCLTTQQKEALNILSIQYIKYFSIDNRPRPSMLLKKILKVNLTEKFASELIENEQLELLRKEINNYLNRHENKRQRITSYKEV